MSRLGAFPTWMEQGLCAQVDPDLWHPGKGETTQDAKRICGQCPVRAICLQYALDTEEDFGIWGGTTPRQRRKLRPVTQVCAMDGCDTVIPRGGRSPRTLCSDECVAERRRQRQRERHAARMANREAS